MRRFEFSDGKSNKFWEIEVEGSSYRTCHGRIGTAGRDTTKNFYSPSAAQAQAQSAIKSKLKKGYVEASTDAPPPAPADASPQAALEFKLATEPEAYEDWGVYADALAEAGDPRGELITIGIALARGEGEAAVLREREDTLLQANASAWFGKFVSDDGWRESFGWTLTAGFWGKIRLWVDYDHKDVDMAKALDHALGHPSALFLRELVLGLPDAEGSGDYGGCVRAIAKRGPFASLRRLTIGDFSRDESEISWVHVGDVGKLWKTLTSLEYLCLNGAGIGLGTPKSSSLRVLELNTGGLPRAAADSLARAELPALERLEVWFGTRHYQGTCVAGQIPGILTNSSFTELRSLALANADFADELVAEVARTPWPPKLEHLDLSMGTMSDAGAERILAKAKRFAKLASLDLSDNGLSAAMCARIQEALPNARVSGQSPGEDCYVSVGE